MNRYSGTSACRSLSACRPRANWVRLWAMATEQPDWYVSRLPNLSGLSLAEVMALDLSDWPGALEDPCGDLGESYPGECC